MFLVPSRVLDLAIASETARYLFSCRYLVHLHPTDFRRREESSTSFMDQAQDLESHVGFYILDGRLVVMMILLNQIAETHISDVGSTEEEKR